MKATVYILFFAAILLFVCCDDERQGEGLVSFGINSHLINDVTITKVFINNEEIGIIPGYCDDVKNCSNLTNLNKEFESGQYSYRVEVMSLSGYFDYTLEGNFELKKDEVLKVFIDLSSIH